MKAIRANRANKANRADKPDKTDRTMRKEWIEKSVVTAVMVLWWLVMPVMGYGADDDRGGVAVMIAVHAAYMVSHANVWHLGGNLFVLWLWRGRLCLLPSLAIAFVCSFLPAVGFWKMGMTVGFSGVLFAMAGIRWGDYCRRAAFRHVAMAEFVIRVVPLALVGAAIPHVNWCLHAYCLLSGFAWGRCWGMRDEVSLMPAEEPVGGWGDNGYPQKTHKLTENEYMLIANRKLIGTTMHYHF